MAHPKSYFKNKVVCVTGAGGSIGSEICRKLVEYEAAVILMVGHSELSLYRIEKELRDLAPAGTIRKALGSVTDEKFLESLFRDTSVEIVIHAAAHKHVPMCEDNPIEAIQNNVGGTITLAEAAARAGVPHFVMVSTDKAVKPKSVMGATKRACELFIQFLSARSSMKCTTVRFGNVLDSSGSVLPLWREQLRQGKPITLTDHRCTRYFMSIPDAVDLTLGAASLPRGGLFVLDMGKPRNLENMAIQLIVRERPDIDEPASYIIETGLRPGEKLEEELTYGGEQVKTSIPRVFALRENGPSRSTRWNDFHDLLMAAKIRHKLMALEKLWEIVS